MDDVEVTKTITQMARFIRQEAEEKASEIQVAAEEEFQITKLQLLEAEKQKLRREYERRENAIEVKKKVEYSKQLNESRLRVLQAREDAVQALLRSAERALAALSGDAGSARYSALLAALLAQALRTLSEPAGALVRCRAADERAVEAVIPEARALFARTFGGEAPQVTIDKAHYLPPPPAPGGKSEGVESCCGGVVVTSLDRRIVCSNTLDDRLHVSYQGLLPALRAALFGAAA